MQLNKKKLTEIAVQNSELVKTKNLIVPKTVKVKYDPVLCQKFPIKDDTKVMIMEMTTDQCARYCYTTGISQNIVAANFASLKHRGGGYKRGSKAQEESLCRAIPTLFESYEGIEYPWEATSVLLTPNVKILRTHDTYELLEEKDIISIGIVAIAAQNLKEEKFDSNITMNTLVNAVCSVKRFMPATDMLILGAWGCGAYSNSPYVIAKMMNFVNKTYGGLYKYIVYAIPKGPNLKEFRANIELLNNPDAEEDEGDEGEETEEENKTNEKLNVYFAELNTKTHSKRDRKDNHRAKYALPEED